MVDDREQISRFYTSIPGFEKVADISVGEYRWLTVTSPEGMAGGGELLPEPIAFLPART